MNWGDHLIQELAMKAGAEYGDRVVKVAIEFHESQGLDVWGMEVYTRFDVNMGYGAGPEASYYLPGSPAENLARLARDSTTIPTEW